MSTTVTLLALQKQGLRWKTSGVGVAQELSPHSITAGDNSLASLNHELWAWLGINA